MVAQGTTLAGRYRLDVRLGAGGMGEVWRGEDIVLARTVAVKVLLPGRMDDPGFAARFQGEARAMATINHPGVVDVYDYGVSDVPGAGPTAYLVMRFVDGEPLDRLLTRLVRIAPEPAMELIAQAASALQAVHDMGIVHRDVKPGNLLVRQDGTLVLTDFGIARADAGHRLTDAGMVLGTAAYCAPEQAEGQPVTPAVDLYALGVVAYECLAGQRPFDGDTPVTIALKHIREDPPPLPPDVPPAVRHVVERALAKDPARRWHSAAEMSMAARQAMLADTGSSAAVSGLTGMIASPDHAAAPAGHPGAQAAYLASPETGTRMNAPAGPTPPPYIMPTAASAQSVSTAVSSPAATGTPAPPGRRGGRGRRAAGPPRRTRPGLIVGVIVAGALLGGVGAVAFYQLAGGKAVAGVEPEASVTAGETSPSPTRTTRPPKSSPTVTRSQPAPGRQNSDDPASPTPTEPSPSPSATRTRSPSPSPSPTKTQVKKTVPAVINLTEPLAKTKLHAAGFKVTVDIYGEPSDQGCTRVLDQLPDAGKSWAVDKPVTIVVAQGIDCGGDPSSTPSPSPTPSATAP
ncbi:serine/threonine protein kinase [Sphaerisporangium album]|uniref:non-specific serine/threonine protein kinase n=1 Tax=Sphaerisporangium album TaxID=509200 RepID=A0A367EK24_9ACTN|nr:serine/threonine protein kinase [Sphaerisporangium album]RCG18323.1 serine/threonine protein kinase [Sphaerisporangium album]